MKSLKLSLAHSLSRSALILFECLIFRELRIRRRRIRMRHYKHTRAFLLFQTHKYIYTRDIDTIYSRDWHHFFIRFRLLCNWLNILFWLSVILWPRKEDVLMINNKSVSVLANAHLAKSSGSCFVCNCHESELMIFPSLMSRRERKSESSTP